jgi:hypothetical protein
LPVKPTHPYICGYPNVSFAILKNGIEVIGRKPIASLIVFGKGLLRQYLSGGFYNPYKE